MMKLKELTGPVLIAAILACVALPALAKSGGELRFADDFVALAAEARGQRVPLMIVFTQETCVYCEIAKRDYLGPMNRSAELRGKVIIREIDIDSRTNLRDFGGQPISPRDFSLRYRVRSVPTVIVIDDSGKQAAPPIVGLISADFYQLYLQQAIDEGRVKMRSGGK